MLHHLLPPCTLHHVPESLDGVEGAGVRRQKSLLDAVCEDAPHLLGLVHGVVVHVHHCLPSYLLDHTPGELSESLRVVASMEHHVVHQAKL